MKTAFSIWNDRVAPVFDVARQVRIIEVADGRVVHEQDESLPDEPPAGKASRLSELGVDTLVCGAVSRPFQASVGAHGIRVIPFVAGGLNDVIHAWLCGNLKQGDFAMPGCCGHGRRRKRNSKEEYPLKGKKSSCISPQSGQGRGLMSGTKASDTGGFCVCPQCGQRESHQRGVPCVQRQCPKCGTLMTRE